MSNVCFTVSHIVLSLTPLWLRLPLVLMGEAVAIRSGRTMIVCIWTPLMFRWMVDIELTFT